MRISAAKLPSSVGNTNNNTIIVKEELSPYRILKSKMLSNLHGQRRKTRGRFQAQAMNSSWKLP